MNEQQNNTSSPENIPTKPHHIIVWVILGLVIVGGIGAYVMYDKSAIVIQKKLVVVDTTPDKGVLIPGIPPALLIDKNAQIVASGKTLDTRSNRDILTVAFNSTIGLNNLGKSYDAYFKANGLTVLKKTLQGTQLFYSVLDTKKSMAIGINIIAMPNFTSYVTVRITQPHVQ